MSLTEVLPTVQNLSRADRLRLIQTVAEGLARDEAPEGEPMSPGQSNEIWSPRGDYKAAAALLEMLGETGKPRG